MSRTENSMKNMVTGLFGQMVTLILQFIYRTIFIQLLGVSYLSINGLFTNILSIFSFAELGIGQAIVFSLYKPIRNNDINKIQALKELYKKTYTMIGLTIFGLGIVFIPFLPALLAGEAGNVDHLYLIYLLFVLDSGVTYFFSYRQSFLSACQKQYVLNVTNMALSILREGMRIVLIVTVRMYIPVLIFNVLFNVFQNAWLSWRIEKMYPFLKDTNNASLTKDEKKSIFKNVRALIIYKIGTLSLNSTDNIIITAVVGLNWVGLYSNYQVLVTSVSAFISILFSSLTASIGNLNAGDDMAQKKKIFNVTNLATFWMYSISSVCFLVALTPTITMWIGEKWTLDFATVVVICLNTYVAGMLYAPFNYRQTMGLFVHGKWRPVISAVINIVVSIILGYAWGLKGVLAGTIISRLTTNVWYDPYIVYKKGFKQSSVEYFIHYGTYLVLLVIGSIIGMMIAQIYVFGGLFDILLHCILCIVILSALYTVLFYRREEFQYLKIVALTYWNKLMNRVKVKKERV